MHVDGIEFEEKRSNEEKEKIIANYIVEKDIRDIVFESHKVKKMINDLKKQKISFSKIAQYLNISNRKLKQIISE